MTPLDDIETYCDASVWKTRWSGSAEPFSSGRDRQRQVSQGATIAAWYGVDHIVRNPDGSVAQRSRTTRRSQGRPRRAPEAVTRRLRDARP